MLEHVDHISKKVDSSEKSIGLIVISFIKAMTVVGIMYYFDFNTYLLASVLVYYIARIHIAIREISMIRKYLAAFYDDMASHKHT